MKQPRKESTLERRLRELQEQSAALQSDIKSINKSLRKYGAVDDSGHVVVAERPSVARGEQPSRLNPNYASSVGTGTTTSVAVTDQEPVPADENEAEVNLFSFTETTAPRPAKATDIFPPTVSETAAPAPRYRRAATPAKPQKLASYLATGDFRSNVPLNHERKTQRFRAIIALIAVATFAYIIYRSVFR